MTALSSAAVDHTAAAPSWSWPLSSAKYDRSGALTDLEQSSLEELGWDLRRWPDRWQDPDQAQWPAIHRLVRPLAAAQAHLDVAEGAFHRRSSDDAVALLLRGCATQRRSFWVWDSSAWAEVLGTSRISYQKAYPGWADSSARSYAIAAAYLFGFSDFDLLGNVGRTAVARKVFGQVRVDEAIGQVTAVLHGWGQRSPQVTARTVGLISHAMLLNHSPAWPP
ncbi:hypothetical protein [Embleya sp. NPDC005971]|uniref:hypothetical protein n=1 Tax=Embleya sp. NPDC005971 TaxID=3156724 RepID=UPI0033D992D1